MTLLLAALLLGAAPDAGAPSRDSHVTSCRAGERVFQVLLSGPEADELDTVTLLAPEKGPLHALTSESTVTLLSDLPGGPCVPLKSGAVLVLLQVDGAPNQDHLAAVAYDPAKHAVLASNADLGSYDGELHASPDGVSFVSSDAGQCGGGGPKVPGRGESYSMCSAFLRLVYRVELQRGRLVAAYDRQASFGHVAPGWFSSMAEFEKVFRYDARTNRLGRVWYQTWHTEDGSMCIAPIVADNAPIPSADVFCRKPAPAAPP